MTTRPSSRTHWAMSLSGVMMTTRSTPGVIGPAQRAGAQPVIGLPLDQRPDDHAQRAQRVLGLGELAQQLARSTPTSVL